MWCYGKARCTLYAVWQCYARHKTYKSIQYKASLLEKKDLFRFIHYHYSFNNNNNPDSSCSALVGRYPTVFFIPWFYFTPATLNGISVNQSVRVYKIKGMIHRHVLKSPIETAVLLPRCHSSVILLSCLQQHVRW